MADLSERERVPETIPIARCRELLGEEAEGLSDDEVDEIRRHAQALAHLVVAIAIGHDLHA
jgi:hypothetical protein